MEEKTNLEAKPSIVPVIGVWSTIAVFVGCPLIASAFLFSKTIGFLAPIFVIIGLLTFAGSFLRLMIDLVQLQFTTYRLTDTRIIKTFGLITQRQRAMPRDRSRTDILTPLIGRIFHYANIRVTSTGLGSIVLHYMPNPEMWEAEFAKQTSLRLTTTI